MISKMFLMLVLLIGIKAESSPMDRCLEMVKFGGKLDSMIRLEQEEQLGIICTNMSSFFQCMSDVMLNETTYDLKDLASILKGTDDGKGTSILYTVAELVEDICKDGSPLLKEYQANEECYQNINTHYMERCENQANGAYKLYRDLRTDRVGAQQRIDEICVVVAYHLGCLGNAVQEKCGERAFRIYKNVTWKIGFFKCGMHSSEFDHILKRAYKPRAHYKYLLPR